MKNRILIIGAGISGEIIGRELLNNSKVELIGYLDDDSKKIGTLLNQKPIFGPIQIYNKIIPENNINQIIISIPSADGILIKKILKNILSYKIDIKIIPGYFNILEQDTKIEYPIRDIDIVDLLGRAQIKLDVSAICSYISHKRILVTGAGGSIGRELCSLIASANPSLLILLGRGENSIFNVQKDISYLYPKVKNIPVIVNITNRDLLSEVFEKYKPQVLFHAAAHKHLPLMENQIKEAFLNNVIGSFNVFHLGYEYKLERLVLISTDKAVRPTSIMGLTKYLSELIMAYYGKISSGIFCAVRFGNVIGSRSSVIPLFKEQIRRGGPVTVTHPEALRYFMSIPEASQLVLKAGGLAKGQEIFILNMGEAIRIYDLAKLLIQISQPILGKEVNIEFIGLRPGEKLHEDLWDSNNVKKSINKDIFISKAKMPNSDFIESIQKIKIHKLSESDVKNFMLKF